MKMKLYTIKDTISGELIMPFTEINDGVMLRGAKVMANSDKPNYLTENAKDKQIISLGEWDNITGEITSKVEFVMNVVDLKEVKKTEVK